MQAIRIESDPGFRKRTSNQSAPYIVESEAPGHMVYAESDGVVSIYYRQQVIKFRQDIWQELAEILNERNLTKYGIRP